jgi:MYXO-CTERM domain-containing protein
MHTTARAVLNLREELCILRAFRFRFFVQVSLAFHYILLASLTHFDLAYILLLLHTGSPFAEDFMKNYVIAGLLVGSLAAMGWSQPAHACSPPLPGLDSTLPTENSTYPANAAIFLNGYSINIDNFTVTVDGQPASLKSAVGISNPGSGIAVQVDPQPAVGSAVSITSQLCNPNDMGCQEKTLNFKVGEADTQAPADLESIEINIFDYPDFMTSGGDCQNSSDLGWWVQVTAKAEDGAGSPRMLVVEALDATTKNVVFSDVVFSSATSSKVSFRKEVSVLKGAAAPEAFCFRARAIDASGNKSVNSIEQCKPCYYRTETGTAPNFTPAPEPMWTTSDIYPGGTCDTGMGGSGGSAGSGGSGPAGMSGSAGMNAAGMGTAGTTTAGSAGSGSNNPNLNSVNNDDGGCSCSLGKTSSLPGSWSLSVVGLGLIGLLRRKPRSKRSLGPKSW